MESEGVRKLGEHMGLIRMLGRSPRSRMFQDASARYWGHQYDDLKDWTESVPLREKRPSVQVRLTKTAVDTVNSRLFGEERRPTFSVEAPAEFDDESAEQLDENGDPVDSAVATLLEQAERDLGTLMRECRLRKHYNEIGRLGMLHGSLALAFHQLESGRIWCELITVADVAVTFAFEDRERADELNLDDDDVLELDEFWRTAVEDPISGEVEFYIHRRLWTAEATIEHEPIAERDVREPADLRWVVDEARTVEHNLGFVPMVWIWNRRVTNDKYGAPLLEPAEYSIEDEYNYTLSQTGRGIRYNQEPTAVFSNVANADTEQPLRAGGANTWLLESFGAGFPPANAQLLEMSGTGAAAAHEYLDKLRKLFYEVAGVVVHDPERFGGVMSGVALKMLLLPLVATVQTLRESYGDALARFLELMLRARGRDVRVTATWPDVVDVMPTDLVTIVTPLRDAYLNGFLTLETVVETLAPLYGIDDPAAYVTELQANEVAAGAQAPGVTGAAGGATDEALFGEQTLNTVRDRLGELP